MKLLADSIVPVSTIVVASIFTFLLYMDFTQRIESSKSPEIGIITFKKKTAQRKYTSQVVWEDVEQRAVVYDGDSVRTANGSEAVIKLRDGSDIELDEESMVLLSMSKEAFDIDFRYGSMNARRKGIDKGDVKSLRIKSQAGEVAIDKSDLSVSKRKADSSINLSVLSGTAALKTSGAKTLVLNENQRAKVTAGKKTDVEKTVLRITSPAGGSVIPYNPDGYSFAWNKSKTERIRLQVSNKRSMKNLLIDDRIAGLNTKKKLNPGRYYVRLSGYDASVKKRVYSDTVRFSIIGDSPVELISPLRNEKISGSPANVFFRWSYSKFAVEYGLELSRYRDFSSILLSKNVTDNSVMIDSLEGGNYFWRVKKIYRGYSSSSKTGSFLISRLKNLPPPVLLFPSDRRVFAEDVVKKGKFSFLWKGHRLYKNYILKISEDSSFKNILVQKIVKGRRTEFPVLLKTGKYFWMIEGVERADKRAKSDVHYFIVVENLKIDLYNPVKNSVIETEENINDMEFSWSQAGRKALYRLEISGKDVSKINKKLVIEKTKAVMKKLSPGRYVWRVSLLDELGGSIAQSKERDFSIVKRPLPPELVYPENNEKIDIGKEKELVFKWKPNPDVFFYRINLFMKTKSGLKEIVSGKTKKSLYRIKEYDRLDYGRVYWNVSAYRKAESGSIIQSRKSRASFVISMDKLDKPEIVTPKIQYIRKQ